jgi:hypothetical protein
LLRWRGALGTSFEDLLMAERYRLVDFKQQTGRIPPYDGRARQALGDACRV